MFATSLTIVYFLDNIIVTLHLHRASEKNTVLRPVGKWTSIRVFVDEDLIFKFNEFPLFSAKV